MPFNWWRPNHNGNKSPPCPILTSKILRAVLENLSNKDLEKCRLVNSHWNKEACRILRKSRVIEFASTTSLFSYVKHFINTKDFPHSSYEFNYCTLRELKSEKRYPDILLKFFTTFGEHITFLHLSLQREYFGAAALQNLLEKYVANLESLDLTFSGEFSEAALSYIKNPFELSKLTSLTVDILSYEKSVKNVELIIRDILCASPNLKKLKSEDLARQTSPILAEILTQSLLAVAPSKLIHLTHLEFMMPLDNAQLTALERKPIPLQVCFIELKSDVDTENFQQFLINFNKTMKKLHLEFPPEKDDDKEFPPEKDDDKNILHSFRFVVPMTTLHFLSLTNFKGSLDIVGNLPQLHTLELRKTNLERAIPHQHFSTNITALELECCESITSESMRKISQHFPTLKRLHLMQASNDIMHAVYEELPFIEDLDVKGDLITDEGICGIPDQISKQLSDADSFARFVKYANYFRQFSYIGKLKNLYTLNLESNSISNVSVNFGLMQCHYLRSLRLASFTGLINEIAIDAIAHHENLTSAHVYMPSSGWIEMDRIRKNSNEKEPQAQRKISWTL